MASINVLEKTGYLFVEFVCLVIWKADWQRGRDRVLPSVVSLPKHLQPIHLDYMLLIHMADSDTSNLATTCSLPGALEGRLIGWQFWKPHFNMEY